MNIKEIKEELQYIINYNRIIDKKDSADKKIKILEETIKNLRKIFTNSTRKEKESILYMIDQLTIEMLNIELTEIISSKRYGILTKEDKETILNDIAKLDTKLSENLQSRHN